MLCWLAGWLDGNKQTQQPVTFENLSFNNCSAQLNPTKPRKSKEKCSIQQATATTTITTIITITTTSILKCLVIKHPFHQIDMVVNKQDRTYHNNKIILRRNNWNENKFQFANATTSEFCSLRKPKQLKLCIRSEQTKESRSYRNETKWSEMEGTVLNAML